MRQSRSPDLHRPSRNCRSRLLICGATAQIPESVHADPAMPSRRRERSGRGVQVHPDFKWRPALARFLFLSAPSGGGLRVGYYIDPLRVRRALGAIVVVPVPPFVRRGLGITLWRVLPSFLTAEWRDVEVTPRAAHRLIAAVVNEVCAEYFVAVAKEDVVAVPFVDPEILIEAVGDGIPGHFPFHPRFEARDLRLRRARGVGEGSVAGVQMGQVR